MPGQVYLLLTVPEYRYPVWPWALYHYGDGTMANAQPGAEPALRPATINSRLANGIPGGDSARMTIVDQALVPRGMHSR